MTPAQNAAAWRMVPVEPTPEMVEAAVLSGAFVMPDVWYRAMLAAAPAPDPATSEGQEVEPVGNSDELVKAAKALLDFIGPKDMRVYASDRPVRDLAAALARAGGDGWRPIAEVEPDGREWLGWAERCGYDVVRMHSDGHWHAGISDAHWVKWVRPLPAAPDAEGR